MLDCTTIDAARLNRVTLSPRSTPLHLALGEDDSPFDMDLLERAVVASLEETDDLDWKQALPRKDAKEEFAKDVAAMANSGGGMIVYGIAEADGPSSGAGDIRGVEGWGDQEERRLRQVAYANIQPPVHGLTFRVVDRADTRIVALQVPGSPDAPHLVWLNDRFIAPIRYGAQTAFMRERDIERAYQARWAGRHAQDALLAERADHLLGGLDLEARTWMVAVAVPKQPRPTHLRRMPRQTATDILLKLMRSSPHLVDRRQVDVNVNPRAGLRRWRTSGGSGTSRPVVVELFDDGGVAFAVAGRPPRDDQGNPADIHMMLVQHFVANAMWLTRLAAEHLHIDSAYDLVVRVETNLPEPFVFRGYDGYGIPLDDDLLTPMRRFSPVTATIEPLGSIAEARRALHELALDVINQSGLDELGETYIRPLDAD